MKTTPHPPDRELQTCQGLDGHLVGADERAHVTNDVPSIQHPDQCVAALTELRDTGALDRTADDHNDRP